MMTKGDFKKKEIAAMTVYVTPTNHRKISQKNKGEAREIQSNIRKDDRNSQKQRYKMVHM